MSADVFMDVEQIPEDTEFWDCFRTRPRVLAQWFHKSRENWKRKYQAVKEELHRLKVRVSDVDQSRGQWKEKALEKDRELVELKAELERLQQRVQDGRGKKIASADSDSRPCRTGSV